MLRSVAAVLAGYATMVIIVMASTFALTAAFVPGGMAAMRRPQAAAPTLPSARYLALNIAFGFIAAFLGGRMTTRIAVGSPIAHLIGLAVVVAAMGIASAFMAGARRQPAWYKVAILLVSLAGIAASAVSFSGGLTPAA